MQFFVACSPEKWEEALKVSKRWMQLLNSDEFLNWSALCEIRAEMTSGARFLLVSPKPEVRFQCSFLCLVAQSGVKKP